MSENAIDKLLKRKKVGEILVERGVITQDQLELALEIQKNSLPRQLLGEVIVDQDLCTADQVVEALAGYRQAVTEGDARLTAVAAELDPTLEQSFETLRGNLERHIEKLEKKRNGRKLPFGTPTLREITPTINRIAKKKLTPSKARTVEKAIRYDSSAPFTISELHGFVHQADWPSARDIEVFWKRTEPLFRLMLEQEEDGARK